MDARTVVLNVAEVVRELTHNADDNSALRVQLYHELERLITESSVERLGLDGTLSWTLDALSEPEKSSAAEIARQRVVELCERRVAAPNVRDDLRKAVRDAEKAAMYYLGQLGLRLPQRLHNDVGFGLVCELDEVELTRGGRSLAAAALVAIVSRVLAQAGIFAVPRDVVISGDLVYNEKKKAWELKPVDGEDKVRIVETYYPHLRRVVLVARLAEQPRLFLHVVEVVPVASLTDLMQAVFGEDCEERFRLAIEQLNGRQDYQRFKQTLSQQMRWALMLSPILSLLICGATLFLLRQTSTQTPPPRRSTPNTEKARPKEPDSTPPKMEQPPQPPQSNVPQPLNIPPAFPQPLPAVAPADAAQQRLKREIEEVLWNAIVREIQFCIDPERVGKGSLYDVFLPPSLGGTAVGRIESRVEEKDERVTAETRPIQFHVLTVAPTAQDEAVVTTREAYLWVGVVKGKRQEPKQFAYLNAYILKKREGRWLLASSRELPYPDKPTDAELERLVKNPDVGERVFRAVPLPPPSEPPREVTRPYNLMVKHWEQKRGKHNCDALFLKEPRVDAEEIEIYNLKEWYREGDTAKIPLYIYNCGRETWKKEVHRLQWWMSRTAFQQQSPYRHILVDKDVAPGEIWTTILEVPLKGLLGTWRVTARMCLLPGSDNEFGDYVSCDIPINRRPPAPRLSEVKVIDNRRVSLVWEDSPVNDDDNPRPKNWGLVFLKYKVQIQGVNRQFQHTTPDWIAGGSHTATLPSWGAYRWRVKSFDGMEESEWSDWGNNFMLPP